MAQVVADTADDIIFAATAGVARHRWLSPVLIGVGAPVVLGLIVAPHLFSGAGPVVGLVLGFVLLVAAGAYVLSIVSPGAPGTLKVCAETKTIVVVRHGLVADTDITIPFADVARIALATGAYRDGFGTTGIEVRTRAGETWTVPCEADAGDFAYLRKIAGLKLPAR